MCSSIVNPMSNPKNDDKVGFKSPDPEENTHREVLYSHRTNVYDSFIKNIFVPQNLFSLVVSRGRSLSNHRFPFRQYPQLREKNLKVDELSDLWTPEKDHGTKRDPAGNRIPLNNYGSSFSSRLQFRRVNAVTVRCTGIIKLMNSGANSSYNQVRAINSKISHRKPKELFHDSLSLPREKRIDRVVERSPLEYQGSEGEAVKRKAFLRFGEIVEGNDMKKRRYQQPRIKKNSRIERDVSVAPGMIHPFFLSRLERSHKQMLDENRVFFPIPIISEGSKQDDDHIQVVKGMPLLLRVERFIKNYENSSGFIKASRITALQAHQLSLRSVIITVLKTLGIFVQIGRQIMYVVESNAILACTKEYLWTKIIKWIDA